jgi:dUTP pyrophosphatase
VTIAYVAHPIDLAGNSSWLGSMLGDLNGLLALAQIGAFKPGEAYLANTGDAEHVKFINSMNQIAIHQADALIAVLPRDVATLGTPVEIGFALSMCKPTVIFTDISHSVQLAAWSRSGAVVLDMSSPLFEWPSPEQLLAHLARSAQLQELKPCQVATPSVSNEPPVLLVSGETVNLSQGKYPGDAGLDLAIWSGEALDPGEFRFLSTGVHVAIPDGFFGLITGRSSTWRDFQCRTQPGVIDSGYRGELKIGLKNESVRVQSWPSRTRLGQLILLPTWGGSIEDVESLPDHERGANGYGSSGR